VGDGHSITRKIVGSLSQTTFFIQTPVRILAHDATVNFLIDVDANWWNVSLINEIFNCEEAELICSIYGYLSSQPER
jgi:hypothetical protein